MKASVFVAEDDECLRDLYVMLLEDEGYKVESAVDGEEALRTLRMRQYDLILLDVIMPTLDGIEVLEHLHAKPPHHKLGRIVMISNLDVASAKEKAKRLGAYSYLIKSNMNPTQFLDHVATSLLKKRV